MERAYLKWINLGFFPLLLAACVSQAPQQDFDKQEAAKARVELGLGYLVQQQVSQAKLNLDKALSYAPEYYLVHSALAYYHQMQSEVEQAEQAYQTAIKLDKNQGDTFNNYGTFLCSHGRFDEAYQQFQSALDTPNYYHQAETYENIALCALSAQDIPRFQQNLALLEKVSPQRAASLRQFQ
ncbi:type IV pilus biogenesis/stability protein PilW [[Pasteurella] aerogenes]